MKFFDCKTAPSARLVRMFIAEKNLDIETIEIDLRCGAHLQADFTEKNPYCTVPVLETETGLHLTSSQGCWRYLEAHKPLPPLLGTNPEEKGLIADRIWRVDLDGFYAIAEAIRNELPGFKDRALTGPIDYDQIPELARRGAARVAHFLETFEAHLLGEDDYVAGASFSAADIMAFVTIEFAGWLKLELPPSAERAHDWYKRINARPSAAL